MRICFGLILAIPAPFSLKIPLFYKMSRFKGKITTLLRVYPQFFSNSSIPNSEVACSHLSKLSLLKGRGRRCEGYDEFERKKCAPLKQEVRTFCLGTRK